MYNHTVQSTFNFLWSGREREKGQIEHYIGCHYVDFLSFLLHSITTNNPNGLN